jgi:hypothetical protein
MSETEERCEACRYFDDGDELLGRCRRYPPKIMSRDTAVFPAVGKDEWCGEFHPRVPFPAK